MASIVNFSKMRRVAVFLPYNKEVNSEKKAIADILRAEGISADFYAVGKLGKGEYLLVGEDMFLPTSLLCGKTYRTNVAKMASGVKVDMAVSLVPGKHYESLVTLCPTTCRVGVNTSSATYDFIYNGEGKPSELFAGLFPYVKTFE